MIGTDILAVPSKLTPAIVLAVARAVAAPAVKLAAVPDTLVITPLAGVPNAGVVKVGLVKVLFVNVCVSVNWTILLLVMEAILVAVSAFPVTSPVISPTKDVAVKAPVPAL